MSTFWLNFIITEATGVATAYVDGAAVPPGIKSALETFIAAASALGLALKAGV